MKVGELRKQGWTAIKGDTVLGFLSVIKFSEVAAKAANEGNWDDNEVKELSWRPPSMSYENINMPLEFKDDGYWRPYLLPPLVADKPAVAINEKPVFTQAMADAGELPPVGSEFMCLYNSNEKSYARCLSIGITSKGLLVHEFLETPSGGRIGEVDSSDGKYPRIKEFKPLDTRTKKQKAVDIANKEFLVDKPTLEAIYDLWAHKIEQ